MGGFVRRKVFLVCWLFGGLQELKWENVAKPTVVATMPDMAKQLAHFPDQWTVTEISCFLSGRPDRFPFAMMWPCLFDQCVNSKHQQEALHLIQSGEYARTARALRESHGVEHHPINIFKNFFCNASTGY